MERRGYLVLHFPISPWAGEHQHRARPAVGVFVLGHLWRTDSAGTGTEIQTLWGPIASSKLPWSLNRVPVKDCLSLSLKTWEVLVLTWKIWGVCGGGIVGVEKEKWQWLSGPGCFAKLRENVRYTFWLPNLCCFLNRVLRLRLLCASQPASRLILEIKLHGPTAVPAGFQSLGLRLYHRGIMGIEVTCEVTPAKVRAYFYKAVVISLPWKIQNACVMVAFASTG